MIPVNKTHRSAQRRRHFPGFGRLRSDETGSAHHGRTGRNGREGPSGNVCWSGAGAGADYDG